MSSTPASPSPLPITIEPIHRPTDDLRELIGELDAELAIHYEPSQRHGLSLDALFKPSIRFFIIRSNNKAVGCGGIALADGFAELKRMYIRPAARGRGVADRLLAHLESIALEHDRSVLRLETGIHQHTAIRFYQRAGFTACHAFPPYDAMPPTSIATSLFLEKRIRTGRITESL